ncbi:alpha/beta hydrolase [Kribbella sp. NPDC051770]|uniref:alpha/beta fold hydrolase n=1 Tax=Kribbella sp. NPDC051770 TaxID=3155413 RepID=UPI00342C4105
MPLGLPARMVLERGPDPLHEHGVVRILVVLVGHSWGGLLSQLVTWQRPDLLKGLVLLDPSHEALWSDSLTPEEFAEASRHPTPSDPRAAAILPAAQDLATQTAETANEPLLRDAYLSYVETDAQLFTILDEIPMILDHLPAIAHHRASATWPDIPITLFTAMKGRPQAFVEPVLVVQEALAAAANAHHTVVPDAGHYIHVDRPDLVIRAVRGTR